VRELALAIAGEVGGPADLNFHPRPVDDPSRRCPDITVAQSQLEWTPRVDLAHGIAVTVRWFRERALPTTDTTEG
jgi:nucleoside-diphosphate-sugar epimerase